MANTMINDLTVGSVPKQLIRFALPFAASNLLQALYNIVDMMVIGQFVGSTGLSAVSVGSDILTLLTMLCMGFSSAGQIMIAQYVGAGRRKEISYTIGTMFSMITLIALSFSVIGIAFANPILGLLNTPEEALSEAWAYLDLTPYLEEYAPHYHYLLQDPQIYNDIVTEEGRIVPFATINSEPAKTGMGPVVNKEYFDATGLDIPTTIDELHDLAVAMKNNGVPVPLAVSEEGDIVEGIVSQAMGASFVGQPIIDNQSGELILDVTTDETRSYIELFRQWYDEGLLDKDFTSITEMDFTPFNSGNVGTSSGMGFMIDDYYSFYGVYQQPLGVLHADGMGDKEVLLKEWPASPVSSMPGISLTTLCETDGVVEEAMRLCDFFYSDYGYLVCNYGWVEGETYDIVDGKPYTNDFFNDRDPELNVAYKSMYTSDGDFGYVYPNFNFDNGSETLMEAAELWTVPEDQPNAKYTTLPGNMKLNAEETSRVTNSLLDLQTYVESTVLLWMTGQTDLTDAAWDEFVSRCQSMNADLILEVYTEAYQRYTAQ